MFTSSSFSARAHHSFSLIFVLVVTITLFSTDLFAANFVVTNGNASGAGSLRQAVLDANANGNPGEVDLINFSGVTTIIQEDLRTVDGGTGPIIIMESVNIEGPGSGDLTIDGVYQWITDGGVVNGGFPNHPTNLIIARSGNLFEIGSRSVDNSGIKVTISGMKVVRTGGLVVGRVGAEVEIVDVFAEDNAFPTEHSNSMVSVDGGKLTIRDSFFSGNKWNAPIIFSNQDTLITNTTLLNIYSEHPSGLWLSGTVAEIVNSQILDDLVQHLFNASDTYIANTVFKRLHVTPIALIYADSTNLHLNNVTIYSNTTPETIPVEQPSHLWLANSSLSMANTVIAPPGPNSFEVKPLVQLVVGSTVALNTNNHVSDGSLPGTATGEAGLEGPFAHNSSFKPLVGSPLIDTGDDAHAVNARSGVSLTTDVLGLDRISGPSVDIGAVEVQENHAVNDSYSTNQGTILTVTKPGVLSNDQWTGTLVFIDNGLIVLDQPEHGVLGVAGREGGFLYVPNAGFYGTDTFTYVVATDPPEGPDLVSNEATVTIEVLPALPSRIVVEKATNPAGDPQAFAFHLTNSSGFLQSFGLSDGQTHNSGDVTAGIYNLFETVPAGWVQSKVECDDGSIPTVIDVSSGETVTCTFTNTELDSIVIDVQTLPGGGTGFDFTHDIGSGTPFSLDDAQSTHFDAVSPGTYTITQADPTPDHDLTAITCQGAVSSNVDLALRTVTVTMAAGEVVHCTFLNRAPIGPDTPVPTLSEWALIILSLMMLGTGLAGYRRYYQA